MKYLYYFLDKYIEVLRYQSIGGVIKYIKLNNLSDAQIPMRSILEQDKIIGILEKLDNEIIIKVNNLEELSNLVKSPIFRGGGCMKKVKLGEVATFINGYAFKPQDWSSEGKVIRIQNLTKTSTEINYYSGTIDQKYIVEDGDI